MLLPGLVLPGIGRAMAFPPLMGIAVGSCLRSGPGRASGVTVDARQRQLGGEQQPGGPLPTTTTSVFSMISSP
ncbi:hypothetical protein [Streptomyces coeruleorubidus]|uniref:hypothetical protein n=1 Tax=Streptomyces coeruleorubidus TaxID=116188 RepID=UPI0036B3C670